MRLSDTIAAALLARVPRDVDAAAWRRGATTVVGVGTEQVVSISGATAFASLDTLPPGTWVGWLAFELGHAVEPVVPRGAVARDHQKLPDVLLARFGAHAIVAADGDVTLEGTGAGHALLLDAQRALATRASDRLDTAALPLDLAWHSSLARHEFEARVDAIVDLLRAGECYQVNLTRRLTLDAPLDPVALFAQLARRHPAPFTGMLRVHDHVAGDVAVVSASPERYLRVEGRHVESQPIKGTAADATVLRASAKDRAENLMIVDLARNDLGRVCEPGSIHVPSLFAIEAHPGLHHLVSTVRGTRRADVGLGALVAATFPPASVTGAPKPRVLQAIEDLEPVRRGVYCGGFGWIDTERDAAELAVAIRTFSVFADHTELGVGAGIVADSSPAAEWEETELKASRLLRCASEAAHEGRRAALGGAMSNDQLTVWINGEVVAERDARVSPFDHGLLVGDGVFETVRVYAGEPFAWTRHLDRLSRSAHGLGLSVPDRGQLRDAAERVLRANALSEARVRITVTGGRAPLGSERGDGKPTVVVAASDLRPWAPSTDVVVVPWPRNERGALAGLKTISYAENVRALAFAHERGAGEAIFANTRDELCEATGSNVFVVRDGLVYTPPESAGCLLGVTRALVLELCTSLGIPAEERALPIEALGGADEAFLTSTVREVQPIAHVDGVALPAAPGAVTTRLADAFTALVARDLDP